MKLSIALCLLITLGFSASAQVYQLNSDLKVNIGPYSGPYKEVKDTAPVKDIPAPVSYKDTTIMESGYTTTIIDGYRTTCSFMDGDSLEVRFVQVKTGKQDVLYLHRGMQVKISHLRKYGFPILQISSPATMEKAFVAGESYMVLRDKLKKK